jgi:CubicO group peptidase (beta-lactamase class C family)
VFDPKRSIRRTAALSFMSLLCGAALPPLERAAGAQPPPRPDGWQSFTRLLEAYADSDHVVGTSAVVLRDGQVLARHHYGFADKAAGKRVDDRSIFHLSGSMTARSSTGDRSRRR